MRKRKRLMRVVIASALLVVAAPSVAAAHNHLDYGHQAGGRSEQACSVDPRDPRLMNPQFHLCRNNQFTAAIPTGQDRAYIQHLVPPGMSASDQVPAASDRTEIVIGWWIVGLALAAAGVAGIIVGLKRERPEALS